ncbi:ribbon-helix-helix domain-containing protein [Nocardiopsis sp. CC223A]|uniref:ribbon-helix-helix domain-containing protein n=1 Tax=Nocardiopsis sp. CC223A TaxID=3044051 RepID=UPI00278C1413|nr:ribbon-helix-helix domain-containing protein [Nocardiopsis sp. CC223A]
MTNRRITVSIPEEILAKVQKAVDSGQAASISAYITEIIRNQPDWADAELLAAEILAESGEPTAQDKEWVENVLSGGEASAGSAA